MDPTQSPPVSPPTRPERLSYDQARDLLRVLEESKVTVETYLEILKEDTGMSPGEKNTKSWWGLHCYPQVRKYLYAHVIIITISLQVLNLVILTVLDALPRKDSEEQKYVMASMVPMMFLEFLNLVLVMFTSGSLAKQIMKHKVNGLLMGQAYMSTVLLFAGIYTVTYRVDAKGWKFVNEDLYSSPVQVCNLYAKFLFYSISTATLCGSDNVLPVQWYNCLMAGFQMLLSFCYFASILGSAISPEFNHPPYHNRGTPCVRTSTGHKDTSTTTTRPSPGILFSIFGRNRHGFRQLSPQGSCHSNKCPDVESPDGGADVREDRMHGREGTASVEVEHSGRSGVVLQQDVVVPVSVHSLQHNDNLESTSIQF